jgi:hypothetical protein
MAVEGRKTVVLSTAISVLGALAILVPVGRWVLAPWFTTVAFSAVAADVDARIDQKTAPGNNGIKAILAANIEELQDIVNMEVARRERAPTKWTELDQLNLNNTLRRLNSARTALSSFEEDRIRALKEPVKGNSGGH